MHVLCLFTAIGERLELTASVSSGLLLLVPISRNDSFPVGLVRKQLLLHVSLLRSSNQSRKKLESLPPTSLLSENQMDTDVYAHTKDRIKETEGYQ